MVIRRALSFSIVLFLGSCLPQGSETKNEEESAESDKDEATPVVDAEVVSATDTKVVATLKADGKNSQLINATEEGELKGTAITFPAGSLSIDTELSLEQGQSLSSSEHLGELGLAPTSEIKEASTSVFIGSTAEQDPVAPFTLALPLKSGTALTAAENLVVFYRVTRYSDGKTLSGAIPASLFKSNAASKIEIEASFFGIYQAVYISLSITERVEKDSGGSKPVAVKTDLGAALKSIQGRWKSGCDVPDPELTFEGSAADGKRFEFNMETFAPTATGTYMIGSGYEIDQLDLENDWLTDSTGRGLNIKAKSGTIVITKLSPLEGTFELSEFYDDNQGDTSTTFSGSIAGSFSVPADGESTGTFMAHGSGDLIDVDISVSNAEYEDGPPPRIFDWEVFNETVRIVESEFEDDACATRKLSRIFVFTAISTGEKTAQRFGSATPIAVEGIELVSVKNLFNFGNEEDAKLYEEHCGISGSEVNVDYEASTSDCYPFPKVGDKGYNVFEVKDGVLSPAWPMSWVYTGGHPEAFYSDVDFKRQE
jgi:hypothetical protein